MLSNKLINLAYFLFNHLMTWEKNVNVVALSLSLRVSWSFVINPVYCILIQTKRTDSLMNESTCLTDQRLRPTSLINWWNLLEIKKSARLEMGESVKVRNRSARVSSFLTIQMFQCDIMKFQVHRVSEFSTFVFFFRLLTKQTIVFIFIDIMNYTNDKLIALDANSEFKIFTLLQ